MTHIPPIPAGNTSPYPLHEPPHAKTATEAQAENGKSEAPLENAIDDAVPSRRDRGRRCGGGRRVDVCSSTQGRGHSEAANRKGDASRRVDVDRGFVRGKRSCRITGLCFAAAASLGTQQRRREPTTIPDIVCSVRATRKRSRHIHCWQSGRIPFQGDLASASRQRETAVDRNRGRKNHNRRSRPLSPGNLLWRRRLYLTDTLFGIFQVGQRKGDVMADAYIEARPCDRSQVAPPCAGTH